MWTVHCPVTDWWINLAVRWYVLHHWMWFDNSFFCPTIYLENVYLFSTWWSGITSSHTLERIATPHRCSGGHTPVTSKQGISSMCSGCLHMAQVMVDSVAPHGYPLNPMTFTIDIETRRNKVLFSIWVTLEQMEKTPSATNQTPAETQHPDC